MMNETLCIVLELCFTFLTWLLQLVLSSVKLCYLYSQGLSDLFVSDTQSFEKFNSVHNIVYKIKDNLTRFTLGREPLTPCSILFVVQGLEFLLI